MTQHQKTHHFFPMQKYIHDCLRNNLRSIQKGLSVPQQKAVTEVVRGLFTAGTPILRHLAQDDEKSAKKQGEKYSHHLGNINLEEKIEIFSLKKAFSDIKKDSIIAYDLTDIAKDSAKKMEKLAKIFDGSERRGTVGFGLHGVGISSNLVRLRVHDGDKYTQNQQRRKIVGEIAQKLNENGIWVFDRGNDDKAFFKFLASELKVRFIVRLRDNRQVVIQKTGALEKIENLKPGKYKIQLLNRNNNKVDPQVYTLIIKKHLKNKPPIRLITNLDYKHYSRNKVITMYLERWGVENIFRRIKTKFNLEKIRVLSFRKFTNLVALIQFATICSTLIYRALQKSSTALLAGILLYYKTFLRLRRLASNIDSFISFMQQCLKPYVYRNNDPPAQLTLLPYDQLKKLGSF